MVKGPYVASFVFIFIASDIAWGQQANVDISRISDSGVGEKIGTVAISEDISGNASPIARGPSRRWETIKHQIATAMTPFPYSQAVTPFLLQLHASPLIET